MPALTDAVTLGNSGLRVSPLCLGTMTFGDDWGWGCPPEDSTRIIDRYLDAGGNFLDTANIYTKGHSEKIIGDHLGSNPSKRERVVLASKWLGNMYRDDPNGGGAGRKTMIASVEHSLRRLQTDHLDLLWMHFWDRHTPIEETMRGLDDLVRAGKVRYIGFSDTPAWKVSQAQTIAHFRGWSPLIALQIEYSLIERTPEGDLFPMAQEMRLGITPWSPLKGGILSGKYRKDKMPDKGRYPEDSKHLNDKTFGIIDALEEIAEAHERSIPQVALAWCRQREGVASPIIGARTMEHLEANLASLELTLSDQDMDRLNSLSAPDLGFPHTFLSNITNAIQNGSTVNGVPSSHWPLSPEGDADRW